MTEAEQVNSKNACDQICVCGKETVFFEFMCS